MADQKTKNPLRGISSLGAEKEHDLLMLVPRGYLDCRPTTGLLSNEEEFCQLVTVTSRVSRHPDRSLWSFDIQTASGTGIRASYFGNAPIKTKEWADLKPGARIHIRGTIKEFNQELFLSSAKRVSDEDFGFVIPVYRSVPKILSGERIRAAIKPLVQDKESVTLAAQELHERLGSASLGVSELEKLICKLHAPKSAEEIEWAMEQTKELSVLAILSKAHIEIPSVEAAIVPLDWFYLQNLKDKLPFSLSESQNEAVEAIIEELESGRPMRALLSGDVGSGKTVTYGLPAIVAHRAGRRVAILAPNTPLASQIAKEVQALDPSVPVSLITSENSSTASSNAILVGTTALLPFAERKKWRADLLIIDEQQKFGIAQKNALADEHTHVLEATATCIPQTLGAVKHQGLKIFRLKGHAKKNIETYIVGSAQSKFMMGQVYKTIQDGNRCILIYPQINTDEENHKRNVLAAAEKWEKHFPGKVVVLHGKLSDFEKARALELAASGSRPIVVATSIVEVGITIPRLRLGIVISADRYGLSTLHQMRGRLARDGGEAKFLLYLDFDTSDPNIPDEKLAIVDRLQPLEKTNDGFKLAEYDAANRGFGDLLSGSKAQHGKTMTAFLGLNLTPEDFEIYGI